VHEVHRSCAEWLREQAYKNAKFMEGKDLDAARESAKQGCLEEYIAAARDASLIFYQLGEFLVSRLPILPGGPLFAALHKDAAPQAVGLDFGAGPGLSGPLRL
jgi:hypothetical protein